MEQIVSLMGILLMFALVLYGSYYFSKKVAKMSLRENRSGYMKLVDRIMVGQDKNVSIIHVGERYFLIGVSSNEISILAELSKEDIVEFQASEGTVPNGISFKEVLRKKGKEKDR